MGQVLKFTKTPVRPLSQETDLQNASLAGFAAGVCDSWRAGDTPQAPIDSGINLEAFENAGIDEYDLEELKEMFQCQ